MANASAIRNASSLEEATGRNQGGLRWLKGDDINEKTPNVSDGTHWRILGYDTITYTQGQNAELVDQAFFVAPIACKVLAISEVHATAGDDASDVNIQVTKDDATDAPGAGTNLLTNNTSAGFDLKGTANTVQEGTLSATDADLVLAAGDRLSLDFSGTLTTAAGVVVTVLVAYIQE